MPSVYLFASYDYIQKDTKIEKSRWKNILLKETLLFSEASFSMDTICKQIVGQLNDIVINN